MSGWGLLQARSEFLGRHKATREFQPGEGVTFPGQAWRIVEIGRRRSAGFDGHRTPQKVVAILSHIFERSRMNADDPIHVRAFFCVAFQAAMGTRGWDNGMGTRGGGRRVGPEAEKPRTGASLYSSKSSGMREVSLDADVWFPNATVL